MEKIILITGGGRGIGAACALLAAQQAYAVCISYVADEASAAAVVADRLLSPRLDIGIQKCWRKR